MGLVTGWAVGFALKKIAKLVALILAVVFVFVQLLVVNKMMVVNWPALAHTFSIATGHVASHSNHWWSTLLLNFPYAGAFGVGFFSGFKKG
jgi:uncharacterized membrane protein (Fun14 family)